MSDCAFCRILGHEAPGSFVYEDNLTAAFLDIHQPNDYKVLVVPRDHVETIYDLNDEQAAAVMQTSVRVARAIREASNCEGLSVFQANGAIAGQEIWHFHLHLLPRHADDRHSQHHRTRFPDRADLDRMAAELRAKLAT